MCSGISIDMCDLACLFHVRTIMFLLCCVTLWFLDMWCYLHLMFVISKYFFFLPPHMRPIMFLLYYMALWWFSDLRCYLPLVFVISRCG